jgi:cytochrome P450
VLDLPDQFLWLKFHEYITTYGPIVQLNLLGQNHILLGTERVVDDLVRARGAIYSGRPQTEAASMLTQDMHILLMTQGKGLRDRRAILSRLLSRSAVSQYESSQWLETYRMIRDIVQSPPEYEEIFEHWTTAMGSRMLYGRAMHERDAYQAEINVVSRLAVSIVKPGTYLVDFIPWMRYIPNIFAPWKRRFNALVRRDEAFYYKMWNKTREDLDGRTDAPSFTRRYLEDYGSEGGKGNLTEVEAVHLMGVTYTAFGTSSRNMNTFLFAMTRHPEWWSRISDEMESIVGGKRLPMLDDLPSLPILRAVLNEITRLWPVTPGGVPHLLTKDDVYQGYYLPAGSVIHLVTWSCGRDAELYPDPESFKPERWLESGYPSYKEPLSEFPTLNNTLMFGAGRRQCPGMLVGMRNVYIQVMMFVWACDVTRARDANGEIVPGKHEFVPGFNVHPKPFNFDLKSRSAERMAMVERQYEKALAADVMRE